MKNLLFLFLLGIATVISAQDAPHEQRRRVIISDNSNTSINIREENGKVFINGKPFEEATAAEQRLYEEMRSRAGDPIEGGERTSAESRTVVTCTNENGKEECKVLSIVPNERGRRVECEGDASDCAREERQNRRVMIWRADDEGGDSLKVRVFGDAQPHVFHFDENGMQPMDGAQMPEMMGMMGGMFEGLQAGRHGFRFEAPNPEIFRLEMEAKRLAQKIKSASGREKEDLKRDLADTLASIYAKKEEARQAKIERLEAELEEERSKQNERRRNKSQIIERRMNELLGEDDALDW